MLRSLRGQAVAALAAALLCGPAVQAGHAAAPASSPTSPAPGQHPAGPSPSERSRFDRVDRLAEAPRPGSRTPDAPGGLSQGRVPGPRQDENPKSAPPAGASAEGASVPCTLDSVTGLSPERFTDFLADPAVTADGCLRSILWTWDGRLTPVMSDAHVQAVSRRATALSAGHDGTNGGHLLEMFTYLHAVAYHDFSREEIDVTDPPTVGAMRGAVDAFGSADRTFDVTRTNAETLREALYAASAPGLRQHQLPLVTRVLETMDAGHPDTAGDPAWGGSALAALSLNYLGVYPGNQDTAFRAAVAADPGYRSAFASFAGHTHLKDTANAWVVRDALGEYGRFGQIDSLRGEIVTGLGGMLETTVRNFGEGSQPWAKVVTWLIEFDACAPYGVCREDIERRIFPHTYTYDDGALVVRTGLDRPTVDQLYYASKQVTGQFERVLGTREPLAGDPNTTLRAVLYASRADYETYHPLLTGMGTNNGGIYIERGATFYTYQRRVPQDSSLTLEELFRHEYTHYLNGRWAVPGFFGEAPWYEGDRTTAMDEGTAEFFAGGTRDDGVRVREALVRSIMSDTAGGGPRMTVDEILHATYADDGFRFYGYAGTLYGFLWTERPSLIREMYGYLRADDPAGFDAWRERLSGDAALQRGYDAFLDTQIAHVDELFVPDTQYTPVAELDHASAGAVRDAFAAATYLTPACRSAGAPERPRFVCTGRVTANLSRADDADQVFRDMSETVDYFILERSVSGGDNLADMNCSFGEVDIWSDRRAGTADYRCEGPLRA
ncbi:collagenase [Streptomyces sp. JJ38]|nr:collagenase [Streptomyces sp. JJ38]